jgi:hypothetical protein
MKTKEQIEQLADQVYSQKTDRINGSELKGMIVSAIKGGFVDGYTKCQEDNKDKKYTEEDIRKAIEVGVNAEAGDYPKGFSHKLGITLEDYFINSLNK